jgi:hypothetical protein
VPRGACVVGWAALTVSLLAGCGPHDVVCPAIGYVDVLVVQLAAGWPAALTSGLSVTCTPACEDHPATDPAGGAPVPPGALTGATTRFIVPSTVRSITVVVSRSGGVLETVHGALGWRRVGGTAECGGPVRATLTLPPP